jgi:hypothetical protein
MDISGDNQRFTNTYMLHTVFQEIIESYERRVQR